MPPEAGRQRPKVKLALVVAPIALYSLVLSGGRSGSQFPAPLRSGESSVPTFRAETNLALVAFQVVTSKNVAVTNLRPDEIELLEDGVPQKVALFEGGELYPHVSRIEAHVVFDCSDSMWSGKFSKGVFDPRVFNAAILDEFPNLRISIWGFSGRGLGLYSTPTRDSAALTAAISGVIGRSPGSTPLYSAVAAVAGRLGASPGDSLHLIVVVSDGHPSASDKVQQTDVAAAARNAGIPIYPVLVDAQQRSDKPQSAFVKLAGLTGGRAFVFRGATPDDLVGAVLKRLAEQIRYSYTAGYYPVHDEAGGLHRVQVSLKHPGRGTVLGGVRNVQR